MWGRRRAAVRVLGQPFVGQLLRPSNRRCSARVHTHHRLARAALDDGGGHCGRGCRLHALPAVLASRTALIPALKKDAASQGFRRSRVGTAFLVAQVSISVVLVIGAALLIRSVRTLGLDPGLDVEHVAYFRMKPRLSGYDQEKALSYFRSLQRHLESLGEVESVAFVRFHRRFRLPPCLSCLSSYKAMHHQPRTKRFVSRSIL